MPRKRTSVNRKILAIRCETPFDVVVVDDHFTARQLSESPAPCGHSHLIIVGKAQFTRGADLVAKCFP